MRSEVQLLLDPPVSPRPAGRIPRSHRPAHPRMSRPVRSQDGLLVARERHHIVQRVTRDAVGRSPSGAGAGGGREAAATTAVFPSLIDTLTASLVDRKIVEGRTSRDASCRGPRLRVRLPTRTTMTGRSRSRLRQKGPSSSGSDQAREGRLVDALAARGDEGRGTLR